MTLENANKLIINTRQSTCAALEVPSGASLTITKESSECSGSLVATSGDYGAGIGGNNKSAGGDITINGGTVTATSGDSGAGIGGGYACENGGTIEISGGKVTATASDNGAGIGSGSGRKNHH